MFYQQSYSIVYMNLLPSAHILILCQVETYPKEEMTLWEGIHSYSITE